MQARRRPVLRGKVTLSLAHPPPVIRGGPRNSELPLAPAVSVACVFSICLFGTVGIFGGAETAASGGGREIFRVSVAALMWPGATRSFLISCDGTLYNGEWVTRLALSADAVPADSPRAIVYEADALPIAHWRQRNGDVEWTCEAAALPSPQDSGLIASVELTATNRGREAHDAAFEASLEDPRKTAGFVAPDAPESTSTVYAWAGEPRSQFAHGWCQGRLQGRTAKVSWRVAPGQTRRARVVVPGYRSDAWALRQWARIPHSRRVREAREYWAAALGRGMSMSLGDCEVETAFREAVIVLLGCTERHSGRLIPIGNPFQYRDVWLRDGARSVAALAMAGQVQTARDLVVGFLAYQWPQGPFLSQRGQLDGTGQALWAFEQVLLRPSPDLSVGRYASAALAAWRWSETQRASTRILGLPWGGLMPYCEPRDGELPHGRAQLVGTDAWSIAGYRSTARLLEASGRDFEAQEVRRARASYVAVFENMLARFPGGDIPASWQGIGRDWGNLSVAYPCQALPSSHPRCRAAEPVNDFETLAS